MIRSDHRPLRGRPRAKIVSAACVHAAAWLVAAVTARAQEPLADDLGNWEPWVRGVLAESGASGGEAVVRSLAELDELRVGSADETVRRRAQAAWARLAWRAASHAAVVARLATSPEVLLERAFAAAELGGVREDAGYAALQLALRERDPKRQRAALVAIADRDFGTLSHGPWVLLAKLDLTEHRLAEARGHLRRAEALLQPVLRQADARPPWLADTYHATRAQEALLYGLLDVARTELNAAAPSVAAASIDRLWLAYFMAAEDFPAAVARGERILRESAGDDAAEIERLVAVAQFRDLRVPLAEDRRPLARLHAALAHAATDATRARILLDLAVLQVDLADRAAADASLAAASALLARAGGSEPGDLSCRLATLRAHVALSFGPTPGELAGLRQRLLTECEALLRSWHEIPVRKGGLGFLQFATRRDALAALVAVEYHLHPEQPHLALAHLMRAQALGTFARRQDVPAGDPLDVQRRLAPVRGGILVFLPCVLGECVFVITRQRLTFHRLPRRDTLLHDLRTLRELLLPAETLAPVADVHACGERIAGKILPADVRAALADWTECVVVGRELLGNLPLEVLPGVRSAWLGCDLAISYLPSLPFGLHRSVGGTTGHAADRCSLVAVTAAPSIPRDRVVPVGDDTARAITAPWPQALCLLGDRASAAALATTDVASSAMTIVLAHGTDRLARPDDERPRGVALADAPLGCGQVEALAEVGVAPLVVLAVCRGGSGNLRRGDDTGNSLVGAFLSAGADAVVAADADLDVRATVAMLRELSRHRAEGHSAAEALRRARCALAETAEFAHPMFHSQLGVFGHERGPPRAVAVSSHWRFLVGTLAVLLAAAAVSWRRRVVGARG